MRTAIISFVILLAAPALAHPPVSVVIDSRGNIYYSDLEQVWRVAPDGKKSVAVPKVHTHELYIDAQDNLFGEHLWYEGERTDKWGHYVWKRDAAGRVSTVVPRTEGFPRDYSFVRDRAGSMYRASQDRKSVLKNKVVFARGFTDIRWMNATRDGTLFLVDNGDIVRITPDAKVTRLAKGLAKTQGIWFDGKGNIYVAHSSEGEVKRVTPDGSVTTVAKSTWPWAPSGGAIANGELLVLEFRIPPATRLRRVRLQ